MVCIPPGCKPGGASANCFITLWCERLCAEGTIGQKCRCSWIFLLNADLIIRHQISHNVEGLPLPAKINIVE